MRKLWIIAAMAAAVLAAACSEQGLEISVVPSGTEELKVFYASFDEGTKTTLSFNGSGTHADVLWEAGDQIRVCGTGIYNNSAGLYAYDVFTTQDGGAAKATFSCPGWNPAVSSRISALYPASLWPEGYFYYNDSDELEHALCVPPVQQAVAGGLESGLSISTASNDSADTEELHFKNILALVRFRLDGSSVGEVTKVRFQANRPLSGDLIYCPEIQEFDLAGWYDVAYGGHQYHVDLTGPFEAGKDYYMAMVPGTSQGFKLYFYDDKDQVILKSSKKTLELNRSRIADFGTITLGEFGALPEGVEAYMTHTKGSKPACIAVVGDAFTASEQSKFTNLAHKAIDAIFNTEPYKTYKDYFTVYLMQAVSNESGASVTDGKGNIITAHDTYFKSKWGDGYADMGSDDSIVFDFVKERCPEILNGALTINEVPVLMIINDSRYGGMCWTWSSGCCIAHVPYTYEGKQIAWGIPSPIAASNSSPDGGLREITEDDLNAIGGYSYGDWRNTAIHEFGGHGFGRLADEYWGGTGVAPSAVIGGHTAYVPADLNISGRYDIVPWQTEVLDELESGKYFNDMDKLLLCAGRAGKFQGGDGYPLGRWRSEMISCMIDNRAYFSLWQRMLIVKRIMSLCGETFDIQDFYSKDVPYDPVRDSQASGAPAYNRLKARKDADVKLHPMLPSPKVMY